MRAESGTKERDAPQDFSSKEMAHAEHACEKQLKMNSAVLAPERKSVTKKYAHNIGLKMRRNHMQARS